MPQSQGARKMPITCTSESLSMASLAAPHICITIQSLRVRLAESLDLADLDAV